MTDQDQDFQADYIELTAEIIAAYVSNNSVPAGALADLLSNVHAAIRGLAANAQGPSKEDAGQKATPAEIKKSISHDALISFEDGKPYKTLKRHLTLRGLTPETYRAKHGLPADYPMVTASYSVQRSELARALGLGQQRRTTNEAPASPPERSAAEEAATSPKKPARAGRPRKATTA